jgi:hypothetical protein
MKAKADKKEIGMKVEQDDFDRYIGLVDQSLRDLLQRLEGHVSKRISRIRSVWAAWVGRYGWGGMGGAAVKRSPLTAMVPKVVGSTLSSGIIM